MNQETSSHNGIKSFVRRAGRLTQAQARALELFWPTYGLDKDELPLNIDHLFQRHAPLVLDIGVGTGASTIHHAIHHPENNYLAIEVHKPGIGHLLNEIEKYALSNIRIINDDVITVLREYLANHSISQCFIFFPDPWPKKRHHKRRLINSTLITLLKEKMTAQARLHIATDSAGYAEHINELFLDSKDFYHLAGPAVYAPRPDWRIKTRYEDRGLNLQHTIYDYCLGLSV